jgi:hypothetical protein
LNVKQLKQKLKEKSVKLYDLMTIQSPDVLDGSKCIIYRVPQNKNRFVDWRISKKLLPGSLVILSHDGFKTIFVALLKNCDAKQRNDTHRKFGYI